MNLRGTGASERIGCFGIALLLLFITNTCFSQNADTSGAQSSKTDKYFKYNGSLNLNAEYLNTSNKSSIPNDSRLIIPEMSGRGVANLNITLFNDIQLPFEMWFSTREVGYQQPFNQFGVNPKISSWLTLHAGYFFTKISDLTFGDVRMMGGGAEFHPGKFKLTALYGRIQDERQPDSSANFLGAYNRRALALKIGYGNENAFAINLNATKAWDERDSAFNYTYSLAPKENFVTSINTTFPITKMARFTAEGAVSVFTDDKSAPLLNNGDIPSFIEGIMPVRYSTMADGAVKASLNITPLKNYSVRINTTWVGPGFYTLGYSNLPNDILDITLAPSLRFLNGNLSIRGSIGFRYNNLRDNKVSDTRRTIGSLDIFSQINKNLSISGQYSNYGMRTRFHRDTIHFQNISQVISISPSIFFDLFNASNTLILTYSYQDVNDINAFNLTDKHFRTHTGNAAWTLLFPSSLNLTTNFYYNDNRSDFPSTIYSLTETAGYSFLDNKLNVTGTIGFTDINILQSDKQLSLRAGITYTMDKYGSIAFNLSNMNYMSGADHGLYGTDRSFNELQGSLQYRIAF